MDYDTKSSELGMELVIRTRSYQIVLDVQEGDVSVSRSEPGEWHIALRRRRCST